MKGFSSSMDNQLADGVVSHIEGSLLYLAAPVGRKQPVCTSHHLMMRQEGVREPGAPAYNDYTIKSGPEHVRELLGRGRGAT